MALGAACTAVLVGLYASMVVSGGCGGNTTVPAPATPDAPPVETGASDTAADTNDTGDVVEPHPELCVTSGAGTGCSDGWCKIPSGTFLIGSPKDEWGRGADDENQVEVTLTRSFLLQQLEVTQAQWTALGFKNPSGPSPYGTDCLGPSCPVGNIDYWEMLAYANKLSEKEGFNACYTLTSCTGKVGEGMACTGATVNAKTIYDCNGYRLPSEAEWEYAARAGTTTTWYSGDITVYPDDDCHYDKAADKIAWYCYNSGKTTHPGGWKQPNAWCLYDMIGNVEERIWDWWDSWGYGKGPLTDPEGQHGISYTRGMRGGGYNDWTKLLRTARRFEVPPDVHEPGFGFRLARTLPPPKG